MAMLPKACKSENVESHNSLNLSSTNIPCLRSNFFECESFLELNSPDILPLCETDLDDSIDSSNISVKGYLPYFEKIVTHMHGLAVCMKEGHSFARGLSLENSDSFFMFPMTLLHSVTYCSYQSPSSLCLAFEAFHVTGEVLTISPSANAFVF